MAREVPAPEYSRSDLMHRASRWSVVQIATNIAELLSRLKTPGVMA